MSIHILVGRVVFIHIRDKEYYPAEDIKIGTIITEELKEKYELYYDEDEYFDVYLSKKYPKFALVLEIVDYVNYMNYKERICGYTFNDQDSFDHFHKDRVENPLESKKLEDVYHSLRMKGTIDVDIEKREIIGELNNYKFIFDLITRDIKSIQNMETGEFLRTSMQLNRTNYGGIAMDYEYKGIRLGDGAEKALDKLEREYIEFDKLRNALLYNKKNEENEEIVYMSIHILVGRVVFIHIRDKEYYPAEDIKIGTIITEELKEKYELYYDEDEYFDVYLSKKYPKFALVLEIVDYVNYMNYKERICGYTFNDQDSFDHFHKDRVENPLESKKLEDVYHSLRMKGTIDVDIEKREIIGELNNYKFIFDLITRDIKSIQNMETGEFLRTSM